MLSNERQQKKPYALPDRLTLYACAWFHSRGDTRNDREKEDWMFVHVHVGLERHCEGSILSKNNLQWPRPGLEPRLLHLQTSALTMRPPQLPKETCLTVLLLLKVNLSKNLVLLVGKFSSLILPRNTIMLQNPIIQFSLSSSCSQEVSNKGNFQTFGSKSSRSHLREVLSYNRLQIWWFDLSRHMYFKKHVTEEKWNQKFNCTAVCVCNCFFFCWRELPGSLLHICIQPSSEAT